MEVTLKEKLIETMYLLEVCRTAQFVLLGGSILSLFIMLFGNHIVSNLHLSDSRQALQAWLQFWIANGAMLLSAAVVIASCVLAYDACQKYKQRFY